MKRPRGKEYNRLPIEIRSKTKLLNDLSGSDWAQLSQSINVYGGRIAEKRKLIGASYPVTLAKHIVRIYTAKGDTVLDPFVGVGTTTDAAKLLGRNGIGFEINSKFVKLARSGVSKVDRSPDDSTDKVKAKIIHDSCLNLKKYVADKSIDLILTSPPYSNLLNNTLKEFTGSIYSKNIYNGRKIAKPYSKDTRDYGNLAWKDYCGSVGKLMEDLFTVARPGSYNVWVVRDYRDMTAHRPYVNLHGKIIELATHAHWTLFDLVIWDQTRERKLVKLGGKICRRFYFNIGHSFLLIFRKNIDGEVFHNGT